jgi:hypothetical protein
VVNSDESIWTPGTPGAAFYSLVLSKGPVTVGDAIAMAAALEQPITAKAVQGHLRWAYTVKGGWLTVNGEIFAQPAETPAEQPAVVLTVPADAREQPKKPKAKARKPHNHGHNLYQQPNNSFIFNMLILACRVIWLCVLIMVACVLFCVTVVLGVIVGAQKLAQVIGQWHRKVEILPPSWPE